MKRLLPLSMVKAILVLLLFVITSNALLAQTPVQKNGQLRVCGTKLCNQWGNPIQLRGMSTHGIQWYYQCLPDAALDALAYDWGSDILRISLYVQEGGYETDPAGFTAKVNSLIEKATARGMYALVDWHQLTPGDPNANLALAKQFFTDIANAHKNKVNIIYDIANEPNNVTWDRIKIYADQMIPHIRNIDSDAVILCGTHGWGSLGISDGRSTQDILNNPINHSNFMYTFHFYAASLGDQYYNELNYASDRLPIFVTEWGTQTASGDGTNNFTMSQRYIDLMRTKKISWTNWNFSDDFRSGAVWLQGTCPNGPWTTSRLKPAGTWVRDKMLSPADDFPGGSSNATFYRDCNYAGTAAGLPVGDYTLSQLNSKGIFNEDISSIRVASGYKVILFEHDNFTGASFTVTSDNSCLVGNGWNDRTSSLKVAANIPSFSQTVEAENWIAMSGVQTESCSEGGLNVGWIDAGDWMAYNVNIPTSGTYRVTYRVASPNSGKTLRLEKDAGATQLGTVSIPNTGNWQNWTSISHNVNLPAGAYSIGIATSTGGFNINRFNIANNVVARIAPEEISITPVNDISLFPNPVKTTLNLSHSLEEASVVQVLDLAGNQIIKVYLKKGDQEINLENLAAGAYLIKITTKGISKIEKIYKE